MISCFFIFSVRIARDLSIPLIFSKKQFLVSLIFLYCFQCCWLLLFIIPSACFEFTLLFSQVLEVGAGLVTPLPFCLSARCCTSLFILLLWLCPQTLVFCISLSFSSVSFFISLENASLPLGLFRSMLFSSQAFVLFRHWFPVNSIVVVEHTLCCLS